MSLLIIWTSNTSAAIEVPYCVDPNWLPYEAIESGQHIGMSAGYIQLLDAFTDYDFKLIKTKSWNQSVEFLKSGQCLLLPMLNHTQDRTDYMDFTGVYFSSPNFLISSQDQPFFQSFENIGQQTLGLTEGYRIAEYVAKNHPDINTQLFATEVAGLTAVNNGDIDLFIGSVHSVNNHIQTLGLTNLKLAGWGGPDDSLRMGVKKGHEQLLNDMDVALKQISQQQHFEIFNRWNDVKVIDNTNYLLVWQVSLAALFILALMMVRYFSVRKYNQVLTTKNHQLSELQMKLLKSNNNLHNISQHDALTGLYNRHYFNQLIASDAHRGPQISPLSLVFLDLDLFKNINDKYGHVIGDEVLQVFGRLLRDSCTDNELICRWGGEEFVIIKHSATDQQARQLCEQIQQNMHQQTFAHRKKLTCSFGIAQQTADESLMNCFQRADEMLYQAKNSGRNRICVATQ